MTIPAFLHRWDHWWLHTCPPHLLALLRMGFGGFLLLYWATLAPGVTMLFSREGLILVYPRLLPPELLSPLFPPSAQVAWIIFALWGAFLLLFTVGAFYRLAAACSLLLYTYEWFLSLHIFGTSFDRIFLFVLFVLLCSGAHKTLSVDQWRATGSIWTWEPISILPQRILALQIAATYLGVGWQKMFLPDWQSGEILPYSFLSAWGNPLSYWLIRLNLPMEFYDANVWITKFFEFLLPIGLWIRRWRIQWMFFLSGAIFHISIALLLSIWWFLVLIPAYIVYLEPQDVQRWLEQLHRKRP